MVEHCRTQDPEKIEAYSFGIVHFVNQIAGLIDDRAKLENKRWLGVRNPDSLAMLKAKEIVKGIIHYTFNYYEDAAKIADAFARDQKAMADEEGTDDGLKAGQETAEFIAAAIRRHGKVSANEELKKFLDPKDCEFPETRFEKLHDALIAERDRMRDAKNNTNLSDSNRHGAHQSMCALDRVLQTL